MELLEQQMANDTDISDPTLINVKREPNSNQADSGDIIETNSVDTDNTENLEMSNVIELKRIDPKLKKTKKFKIKETKTVYDAKEKTDDRCRPYKCSMCDKRSNWRYDVRNHIALHHPSATLIKLSEAEARTSYAVLVDQFREQRKLTNGSTSPRRIRFKCSRKYKKINSKDGKNLLWDTGLTDPVEEISNVVMSSPVQPLENSNSCENLNSECQTKILVLETPSESLVSEIQSENLTSEPQLDCTDQNITIIATEVLEPDCVEQDSQDQPAPVNAVDLVPEEPKLFEFVVNPDKNLDESLQKWVDQLKLKRFKCSGCPYRSNFRGDLSRHIKKRHRASALCVVRILTVESASATVGCYRFKWSMEADRLKTTDGPMKDEDESMMFEADAIQEDIKIKNKIRPVVQNAYSSGINHRIKAPKRHLTRYADFERTRPKVRQRTDDARKCCDVCPFITDKSGHLKLHMSYHQPQPRNTYRCRYCPFYVRTARLLDHHLLLHLQKGNVAGGVLGREEGDSEYQDAKRTGLKYKYICDQCPYVSYFRNDYWLHRRNHFEKASTPFKCNFCRYWVVDERLLIQHQLLHAGTYCPRWSSSSFSSLQATRESSKNFSSHKSSGECRCTFAEGCTINGLTESLRCGREIQCPYCCYTVVSVVLMRQHYIFHISCSDAKSTPLFSTTLDTADDYLSIPCRQNVSNSGNGCYTIEVDCVSRNNKSLDLFQVNEAETLSAPVLEREIRSDDIVMLQPKLNSELVFERPMPVLEQFMKQVVQTNNQRVCLTHKEVVNHMINHNVDCKDEVQTNRDSDKTRISDKKTCEIGIPDEESETGKNSNRIPLILEGEVVKEEIPLAGDIVKQAMQLAGMLDNVDDMYDDSVLGNSEEAKFAQGLVGINDECINGETPWKKMDNKQFKRVLVEISDPSNELNMLAMSNCSTSLKALSDLPEAVMKVAQGLVDINVESINGETPWKKMDDKQFNKMLVDILDPSNELNMLATSNCSTSLKTLSDLPQSEMRVTQGLVDINDDSISGESSVKEREDEQFNKMLVDILDPTNELNMLATSNCTTSFKAFSDVPQANLITQEFDWRIEDIIYIDKREADVSINDIELKRLLEETTPSNKSLLNDEIMSDGLSNCIGTLNSDLALKIDIVSNDSHTEPDQLFLRVNTDICKTVPILADISSAVVKSENRLSSYSVVELTADCESSSLHLGNNSETSCYADQRSFHEALSLMPCIQE